MYPPVLFQSIISEYDHSVITTVSLPTLVVQLVGGKDDIVL